MGFSTGKKVQMPGICNFIGCDEPVAYIIKNNAGETPACAMHATEHFAEMQAKPYTSMIDRAQLAHMEIRRTTPEQRDRGHMYWRRHLERTAAEGRAVTPPESPKRKDVL